MQGAGTALPVQVPQRSLHTHKCHRRPTHKHVHAQTLCSPHYQPVCAAGESNRVRHFQPREHRSPQPREHREHQAPREKQFPERRLSHRLSHHTPSIHRHSSHHGPLHPRVDTDPSHIMTHVRCPRACLAAVDRSDPHSGHRPWLKPISKQLVVVCKQQLRSELWCRVHCSRLRSGWMQR